MSTQEFRIEGDPRDIQDRLSIRKWQNGYSFETDVTRIGNGLLGTKVETLLSISHEVRQSNAKIWDSDVDIALPHMHVIATDYFDQFIAQNGLNTLPFNQMSDNEIARAFVDGFLPTELVVRLYSLVELYGVPLSVRPSRLTALPFSYANDGIIRCKMVPNNQDTVEERAIVLQDAVKLIYATSFSREYRDHLQCIGQDVSDDKTAVIIQEVSGERHGDLFFPIISGTAYSCNFFPQRQNGLFDGSASLTMGLAKGSTPEVAKPWCYAMTAPSASVPFTSARHKLTTTQTRFFAIDMTAKGGDRLDTFEYLTTGPLDAAETAPGFELIASTYDAQNDRFVPGIGNDGARVVDFAPLLVLKARKLNDSLRRVQRRIEDTLFDKVAIEFAVTTDSNGDKLHIDLLQVTPLFMHTTRVRIDEEVLSDDKAVIASERALGNGMLYPVSDIVYIDPETFSTDKGHLAASEVEAVNRTLVASNRPYIFIAMGRIGTSDPFRGLQVMWHQISGARVFIETDLPDAFADFSGGSHFFSDLVSCGSFYLYVPMKGRHHLDFERLKQMPAVTSKTFVRHVRSAVPLKVMVDGRTQRGVVVEDRANVLP